MACWLSICSARFANSWDVAGSKSRQDLTKMLSGQKHLTDSPLVIGILIIDPF